MTRHQKAGQKGGKKTARSFSSEHFQRIGTQGGVTCRTLYGAGLYSAIRTGKKGQK
jgi:hypothetical protein